MKNLVSVVQYGPNDDSSPVQLGRFEIRAQLSMVCLNVTPSWRGLISVLPDGSVALEDEKATLWIVEVAVEFGVEPRSILG